jgi:hypothetical protein
MRHHNFAVILFTATLLSGGIATIGNADAKKVGPKASGYAIEQCLLASDAQTRENDTKSACCSHEAGICVVCPKPPSAGASCDVTPYRPNPIRSPRAMSPDTLNGLGVLTK